MIVPQKQLDEMYLYLSALQEPLGRFDKDKLAEVRKARRMLTKVDHLLETVEVNLVHNCPHPFTREDNGPSWDRTTYCRWCGSFISSTYRTPPGTDVGRD